MKNKKRLDNNMVPDSARPSNAMSEKKRKAVESTATFGLILVAVSLAAPFTDLMNFQYIKIFKWIYAPGALIFTIARIVGANDPGDSKNIKRLRRLEFWAGIAFCIGAFFWFYNEETYKAFLMMNAGALVYLRETIMFSLVGALIQVIASWLIYFRQKKELRSSDNSHDSKK